MVDQGLCHTAFADTAEQLYFQLKEFEDFRQPGFNVLYVQIPRPEWARNPLAEAFSAVISETAGAFGAARTRFQSESVLSCSALWCGVARHCL